MGIHPSSVLHGKKAECVVFNELVRLGFGGNSVLSCRSPAALVQLCSGATCREGECP